MREVVWLSSGDPPASLQAPLVQELRKRPAEALRKAALHWGEPGLVVQGGGNSPLPAAGAVLYFHRIIPADTHSEAKCL